MIESITNKNYKKLAIEVSLQGFSFAEFDTILQKPISVKKINLEVENQQKSIENLLKEELKNTAELHQKYDEIIVIHHNSLSTFVPVALFDQEFIGSYLQYNTKVFETDFFTFDELQNYQINHVYIPYTTINNLFFDVFGSFNYKHSATILVEKLLDLSKNNPNKKMFVYVAKNNFEIVVIENQKLLFYNSFDYKTPEDFIYYILFSAEQLQLNPEVFLLEILGDCTENSDLFAIAFNYVRHVSLWENPEINNSFTRKENREHFILFNS